MSIIQFNTGGDRTMSSLFIAEITGKRHDNVIRDIRSILVELHGEGGLLKFEDTHTNSQNGQSYPIFQLPERELLILLSGYSVTMRANVIDRWRELEAEKQSIQLPKTMAEALRLYADEVEAREALQIVVAEQEPKVEALDRLANADGSMNITAAAKHLQIGPKKLFEFLQRKGWIYRRTGCKNWLGYQTKTQQGLLEHKVKTITIDGVDRIEEQVRVTAKGLAKLAEYFGGGGEQAA